MKKYLVLLKLSWQNGLVYRTSVIMWRFRNFLSSLMSLTVWTVIFESNPEAFGYTKDSMISYIFLVAFLQSLILSSALNGLAQRVYSGEISNLLLKPVNIFIYFAIEEVADKMKNIFFLIFETLALYLLFLPTIIFPSAVSMFIFIIWSLAGLIINFFITLLFGSLGFWSPQTWGPRFLFFMIVSFTAGKLYPLDILPRGLQIIVFFTPFPYLSFFQVQLFLQRLTPNQIYLYSAGFIFWILALGFLSVAIWKKGLKTYEAVGQ